MSATGLGVVAPTTAILYCPECKEGIEASVEIVLMPGEKKGCEVEVRAVTSINTNNLWAHYAENHGPRDPFEED